MGKGQRAREARTQAKNDNPQIKTAKKNNGGKSWVTPLVTALVVVLIVGIFLLTYLSDNGIILRGKTVLETENYKVTGTMLKYAAMSTYNNMVSQWGEEIAQYLQFDNMRDSAQTALEQYLVYAEAAKEAGVTLDDKDYENIDANINAIEEAAEINGYSKSSYMAMAFGKGVKEKDVRAFLELATLATKYEDQIYDETEDAVTDEEINDYYIANVDTLAVADVIKYTETLTLDEALSEDEKTAKKEGFLAKFDAMGAAVSEEEFKTALLAYLTDKATEEGTLDDESAASPETQVENAYTTISKSEVSLADAADWLFEMDGETHLRAAGEVKVFTDGDDAEAEETEEAEDETESESESASSNTYTVEVYYIVKAPYPNDEITKSTGHILIDFDSYETAEEAKAKADEVYAEYLAGEQTKDSFEALAEKYTDDSGVFYNNISEGEMVAEFEAWVYDEARVYGDTGIVETEYGYHIMFFTGEETWLAESRDTIVSEKTGDIYTDYQDKYPVKVNESAIKSVKG